MRARPNDQYYMTTVKIGPKGQIVIPKEAREMFGLAPGDTMVLMADKKRGIALQTSAALRGVVKRIFNGESHDIDPEVSEEEMRAFADEVQDTLEEP